MFPIRNLCFEIYKYYGENSRSSAMRYLYISVSVERQQQITIIENKFDLNVKRCKRHLRVHSSVSRSPRNIELEMHAGMRNA